MGAWLFHLPLWGKIGLGVLCSPLFCFLMGLLVIVMDTSSIGGFFDECSTRWQMLLGIALLGLFASVVLAAIFLAYWGLSILLAWFGASGSVGGTVAFVLALFLVFGAIIGYAIRHGGP